MLETLIISLITKLAEKLFSWLGKKIIDIGGNINYSRKLDDATRRAIEDKQPSDLEDLARNLK